MFLSIGCSPGSVTLPEDSTTWEMDTENRNSPERVGLPGRGITIYNHKLL
jgi:hypothetical protein